MSAEIVDHAISENMRQILVVALNRYAETKEFSAADRKQAVTWAQVFEAGRELWLAHGPHVAS
jgi:hypothetical protein